MALQVSTKVLGNPLILVGNETTRPDNTDRVGSVKLIFPDGTDRIIRVYGTIPMNDRVKQWADRVEFEKLLRVECESRRTLDALFRYTGDKPRCKRFNPSQKLVDNGWRNRDGDCGWSMQLA